MCLETARGDLVLVKQDGKEDICLPQMIGRKAQTFKEIKQNLKYKTSRVVLRNNETIRS